MRVGVLGAGQLGRMLALAGHPLGATFRFVDPKAGAPAAAVGEHIVAGFDVPAALDRLAECDVVTFEFENVPAATTRALEQRVRIHPPPQALEVAQDRLREKSLFRQLGIPTAAFAGVDDAAGFARALEQIGLPAVLKTRRLGYDGKGQRVIHARSDAERAFAELAGVPLILEAFVGFSRELSILGVRSASGETRLYPLIENQHENGILSTSRAPADSSLGSVAEGYARLLLEHFGYVGVLALELFQVGDELYANEIAPRVHNSGHLTIEGAVTSQFENHLRAILDLPLGSTELRGPTAMVNLIGSVVDPRAVLAIPDAHLHDYGKPPRAGRKVGHVTVRAPTASVLEERIAAVLALSGRSRG